MCVVGETDWQTDREREVEEEEMERETAQRDVTSRALPQKQQHDEDTDQSDSCGSRDRSQWD